MEQADNPLNGKKIEGRNELEEILDKLRHRRPFGLELTGENDFSLDVCLAETFGSIQHTASDGDSAYLRAVAPGAPSIYVPGTLSPHAVAGLGDEENGARYPEFLVGGTPGPVPTRYCVPCDLLKRIAVHFLETGEREPGVQWEQQI